jgi:hypothetical protein
MPPGMGMIAPQQHMVRPMMAMPPPAGGVAPPPRAMMMMMQGPPMGMMGMAPPFVPR